MLIDIRSKFRYVGQNVEFWPNIRSQSTILTEFWPTSRSKFSICPCLLSCNCDRPSGYNRSKSTILTEFWPTGRSKIRIRRRLRSFNFDRSTGHNRSNNGFWPISSVTNAVAIIFWPDARSKRAVKLVFWPMSVGQNNGHNISTDRSQKNFDHTFSDGPKSVKISVTIWNFGQNRCKFRSKIRSKFCLLYTSPSPRD